MAASLLRGHHGRPAPLDWLYDLSILTTTRSGDATFAARSADLSALAAVAGLNLQDILAYEPDMAALAIEHALSPFLDALERRLGERLTVVELRRARVALGEAVERDIAAGDKRLRLALASDGGRLARAFAKTGEPPAPSNAAVPPRGQWRVVVGPLDLPEGATQALRQGDALGFDAATLPAALRGDDGALWASLRYERGAFRLAAKGRVAPAPGAWIELNSAAVSPETLIVGDEVAVDPGRARLVAEGARIEGRLVEIDGGFGFQAQEETPR